MKRYLYFGEATVETTGEACMFAVDTFLGMTPGSSSTTTMHFNSRNGAATARLILRLTAQDLRELNILKYYRLTRKWVCKTYGLNDADLELLIYLDCKGRFTRQGFIDGSYTMSWDKNRWERLKRDGWIETWRHRNRTTIMYSIFKTSFKCSQIISRVYRILLGEEDLPTSERSVFYNNKSYTDKVYNKAIDDMIKDKER
jgi:hypothetical protein